MRKIVEYVFHLYDAGRAVESLGIEMGKDAIVLGVQRRASVVVMWAMGTGSDLEERRFRVVVNHEPFDVTGLRYVGSITEHSEEDASGSVCVPGSFHVFEVCP